MTDTLNALVASIVRARKEQIPVESQDNGQAAVLVTGIELARVNSDGQLVTGR